mmetsp:Transcript_1109/g.2375  ORF Transcript_1109/g.2375 Transcript_1109/m.2375 type:complete len:87 (-) Transcript_1109:1329-1589(-)
MLCWYVKLQCHQADGLSVSYCSFNLPTNTSRAVRLMVTVPAVELAAVRATLQGGGATIHCHSLLLTAARFHFKQQWKMWSLKEKAG